MAHCSLCPKTPHTPHLSPFQYVIQFLVFIIGIKEPVGAARRCVFSLAGDFRKTETSRSGSFAIEVSVANTAHLGLIFPQGRVQWRSYGGVQEEEEESWQ
jgi:hypothetical protein